MANKAVNLQQNNSVTPKEPSVNMDEVLDEVGHFGLYQRLLFALVTLPIMFSAIHNSQYVFNAADLKYRCLVPECEKPPGQWTTGPWAEWTLVSGSKCERRQPILSNGSDTLCQRKAFSTKKTVCTAWVYKTKNTIVAEFNLACKDWQRALVGSIHSFGVFTALLFIGVVSDTIGRRTTFILTSFCGAIMGLIRSFAPSYIFYIIFEYLDATLGAGLYSTGFILVVEMVGEHKRVLCGSILAGVFACGLVLLATLAWLVPYWRTLTRILYTPPFIFVFYFFCLSESIRWLITKGKSDKAINALQKVAKMNGRRLSKATIKGLTVQMAPLSKVEKDSIQRKSVWRQVIGSKILITRVIVCASCWMTVTFVYYGLSINSVSLLGNMYTNFMLTAIVEIPGYFMSNFSLDRFGRRRSIQAALLTCGGCLFLFPIIPTSFQILPTLLAKSSISMAFVSVYIFTLELFPTSARHSLMALCSLLGRIGSITAPLSPLLLKIRYWLPYLLFAALSCTAALALTMCPETLRKPMPETVSQAERIHLTPQTTKRSLTRPLVDRSATSFSPSGPQSNGNLQSSPGSTTDLSSSSRLDRNKHQNSPQSSSSAHTPSTSKNTDNK